MTDAHRAPTARAVAERAGVSVTTVSRVLSGQATAIPESTQNRVLEAARELRYRPNTLARALRKGTTQSIGLIVPDVSDAYFHQIARGVEDVAQAAGCVVILANTDRIPERELACVNLLLDKRVDGIVFAGGGVDDDAHLADTDWGSAKVIVVGPHALPFPSVTVDDTAAIADGVRHLHALSCRRVLCLAGRENWLITQRRLAGYRQAVGELGLDDDPGLVVFGDFTEASGEELTAKALASATPFDAVVAFNDYAAIGAVRAIREAGLRVPGDIAVVGCDDIPVARMVHPALTTIGFSQYDFGRTAAELLLDPSRIPADGNTTFPYELVIRDSTAHKSGE